MFFREVLMSQGAYRMAPDEETYNVVLEDGSPRGRPALVLVYGREKQTVTLVTDSYKETWAFSALIEEVRHGTWRQWLTQVPTLVQRINGLFAKERQEGQDPSLRWTIDEHGARRENLATGNNLYLSFDEMRTRIRNGEKLPSAFSVPEVRRRLGLA
jgi:hypothetical protein